jgi:Flp pilus assembly protein TadD
MPKKIEADATFETGFFESILRNNPSDITVLELLGGLYTRQGRIMDGLRVDRRLVRLQPDNATAHYNLACSLALTKRTADALRTLRRAVSLGYHDFEFMAEDPDLVSLRKHPEFRRLLVAPKASA